MATQVEIVGKLNTVIEVLKKSVGETATLQKSVDELNAKIVELQAIIDGLPPGDAITELVEAADEVARLANVVDENIPDPPVIPVVPA